MKKLYLWIILVIPIILFSTKCAMNTYASYIESQYEYEDYKDGVCITKYILIGQK